MKLRNRLLIAVLAVSGLTYAADKAAPTTKTTPAPASENVDADLQAVTAELMQILNKESGGDSQKMMDLLAQWQSDPQAVLNKLKPESRERLMKLATKLDALQKQIPKKQ